MTIVKCCLEFNISNYANSNQSVLIDYGDGSSETIYINPYCNKLILIITFTYFI